MTSVTLSEFCGDPAAILERVEHGERIEVTHHGDVIAVVVAPDAPRHRSRFDELVAQGVIRPAERGLRACDWDQYTHLEIPDDVDPLAILEEDREDPDWLRLLGTEESES